jgi:hypothetical protein
MVPALGSFASPPLAASAANRSPSSQTQGKGKFYDLETLLFFSKHVHDKFTEYFKKAGKEIGKQVTFLDRMVRHPYAQLSLSLSLKKAAQGE